MAKRKRKAIRKERRVPSITIDWTRRNGLSPYFNKEEGEYWITVVTGYENTGDKKELKRRMEATRPVGLYNLLDVLRRHSTLADFEQLLSYTSAVEWHIDPRPCSKLKVLVTVPMDAFNSIATDPYTRSPFQAPIFYRRRPYSRDARVDEAGVAPFPGPVQRFMDFAAGLQDSLALEAQSSALAIGDKYAAVTEARREAIDAAIAAEACGDPETKHPWNSQNDLYASLALERASSGREYEVIEQQIQEQGITAVFHTEHPVKEFEKRIKDFASLLENYDSQINSSKQVLQPPTSLTVEAAKLKQIPGLLNKLFKENTYQEKLKIFDLRPNEVPEWKKAIWKNDAIEGGKLRKNKEDVIRFGFDEGFNVVYVALNQKVFWTWDDWKLELNYLPVYAGENGVTIWDEVPGKKPPTQLDPREHAVVVGQYEKDVERGFSDSLSLKDIPAGGKLFYYYNEDFELTPDRGDAELLGIESVVRVLHKREDLTVEQIASGEISRWTKGWANPEDLVTSRWSAHARPIDLGMPDMPDGYATVNEDGKLERDPNALEISGELPYAGTGWSPFGGVATEHEGEADPMEHASVYPLHWKVPFFGWQEFKNATPICSTTTMSLLHNMAQYFRDLKDDNVWGGTRPTWQEFLGFDPDRRDIYRGYLTLPGNSELSLRMQSIERGDRQNALDKENFPGNPPERTRGSDMLEEIKDDFSAPFKTLGELKDEIKIASAPNLKKEILKDRSKVKEMVTDNITKNVEEVMGKISEIEDLYTHVLDKYGIEPIIKLAIECLAAQTGLPFDQLPDISAAMSIACPPPPTFSAPTLPGVLVEQMPRIPGINMDLPIPTIPEIPNLCEPPPKIPQKPKIPKITVTDMWAPMMKEIGEQILQQLLDALLQIIMQVLTMLLELCINDGNGRNFGDNNLNDMAGPRALDNALGDFGIPPSALKSPLTAGDDEVKDPRVPPSGLFDDISTCLSPLELCQLLGGNPSPAVMRIVEGIISSQYPDLRRYLADKEMIRRFFQTIGNETQVALLCEQIEDKAEQEGLTLDICLDTEIDELRCELLAKKGVPPEQCAEMLENARCRDKKRLDDLLDILSRDNILDGVLPDNMLQSPCNPDGIVPRDPPFVQKQNDRYLDSLLGAATDAFGKDIEAYPTLLMAAETGNFGMMGAAMKSPAEQAHEIFPAFSIGIGADNYLEQTGLSRDELKYKINKARQFGGERLDGRDPPRSWDGDFSEVPSWMKKSGNRYKAWYVLWLGKNKVGDIIKVKDPLPKDPIGKAVESMKALFRLPPLPHHMVYRLPDFEFMPPAFGEGTKTAANDQVMPRLRQTMDEVQQTTLNIAQAQLLSYLGASKEIKTLVDKKTRKTSKSTPTARSPKSPMRSSAEPMVEFMIGKFADDLGSKMTKSLENEIRRAFSGNDARELSFSMMKDVSRKVSSSQLFTKLVLEGVDWTPDVPPPGCPPLANRPKGLMDLDDAKKDTLDEYMTPECSEEGDLSKVAGGPADMELAMLATIVNMIVRLHVIEIVIKGLFVFSEYRVTDAFKEEAVIRFLNVMLNSNLKNMGKEFYPKFKSRAVELITRRVRRGETIYHPNGALLTRGERIKPEDAIRIIAREQLPEVADILGDILNSPKRSMDREYLEKNIPILDVPSNVRSNGVSDDDRFAILSEKYNQGAFFLERYVRIDDKRGSRYLRRSSKYRGVVRLDVWEKYWNDLPLGRFSNKEAMAKHHFDSWKFGYRICYMSKGTATITRKIFDRGSSRWQTKMQRREKTYKLKDGGTWYYPIVISSSEQLIPFTTTKFDIDRSAANARTAGAKGKLGSKSGPGGGPLPSEAGGIYLQAHEDIQARYNKVTGASPTRLERDFNRKSFEYWSRPGKKSRREKMIKMIKRHKVRKDALGGNLFGYPNKGKHHPFGHGLRANSALILADAIRAHIKRKKDNEWINIILDRDSSGDPISRSSEEKKIYKITTYTDPAESPVSIPIAQNPAFLRPLMLVDYKIVKSIVKSHLEGLEIAAETAVALDALKVKKTGTKAEKAAAARKKLKEAKNRVKMKRVRRRGIAKKDNKLKDDLIMSPGYRQVLSNVASPSRALSVITVFCISSVEAELGRSSDSLFRETKKTLRMLFNLLEAGDDPFYQDPEAAAQGGTRGIRKRDARNASTEPDPEEMALMILKMILMTPLYILKGLAELVDPAILVGNILKRFSTEPDAENQIHNIVFPPGMFGTKGYQLMAPKPPKPPKPPPLPVLGEDPWRLPDPPVLRGSDPDQVEQYNAAVERYEMVVDTIEEQFNEIMSPLQEAADEYNEFWDKMDADHAAQRDGSGDSIPTVDFTPKDGFPLFPFVPLTPLGIIYLLLEFEEPKAKEKRREKERDEKNADKDGEEC